MRVARPMRFRIDQKFEVAGRRVEQMHAGGEGNDQPVVVSEAKGADPRWERPVSDFSRTCVKCIDELSVDICPKECRAIRVPDRTFSDAVLTRSYFLKAMNHGETDTFLSNR